MRKLLWNWTALLASVVALGSAGGQPSPDSGAERLQTPAERTQAPAEARSSAVAKTPLPPAKYTPTGAAAEPGSRGADQLRWSSVSTRFHSTESPAGGTPRGAPRFPTGPPQA